MVDDTHDCGINYPGIIDGFYSKIRSNSVYLYAVLIMQIIKTLWYKWKKVAHKIAVFQSRVILTILYFTILLPFGIVFSLFKDALNIKHAHSSNWIAKNKQPEILEEMREQY